MITRNQILAEVPADILLNATDDNKDGVEDDGILDGMIANAMLTDGLSDAAVLVLVCDSVYRRAKVKAADNPFRARAQTIIDQSAGADAEHANTEDSDAFTMEKLDQL